MKWIKSKEKRSDITVLPILPGTLILCATMLIAFLILLVVLNLNGMIDLPQWAERLIGTAEDLHDEDDSFGDAFLESLSGTQQNVDNTSLFSETDKETLLSLLQNAPTVRSYYQTCTLERINTSGRPLARQVFRLVSDGREHIEVLFRGQLEKSVTINDTAVAITTQGGSRVFDRSSDSVFFAESEVGFPSYDRMLEMLAQAEQDLYTLTLSASQNMSCIRAEFTDKLSGTREVFDILPDCRIIIAASSYLPNADSPYYVLTTTSLLTDATGFDESVFDISNP